MAAEPLDPIAAILRSWRIVAVTTLVGAIGLSIVFALQATTFSAQTSVLWGINASDQDIASRALGQQGSTSERALSNQVSVITSDVVVQQAAQELGVDADDLRGRTTAWVQKDSDLLVIQGTGTTGMSAAQLAQAVLNSYMRYNQSEGARLLVADAEARRASAVALEAQLAALVAPPQTTEAMANAYATELAALAKEEEQLRSAAAAYQGSLTLLVAPSAPAAPSSPGPIQGGVVGASLGLVLGTIVALARAASGRRQGATHRGFALRRRTLRRSKTIDVTRAVDRSRGASWIPS